MFYFYCQKCGHQKKVQSIPRGCVANTRDGFGKPIYHYECENCKNLDAGFMKLDRNEMEEIVYLRSVISLYQDIRGFNKQ